MPMNIKKSNISLLLLIVVVLSTLFCGCISPDDSEDETVPEETEAPENAVFYIDPEDLGECFGTNCLSSNAAGISIR